MVAVLGVGSASAAEGAGSAPKEPDAVEITDVKNLKPRPLKERVTLKSAVGAPGIETFATLLLAQELGEFEKENITLETSVIPNNEITVLLAQDQLQIAPQGYGAGLLNVIAGGSGIKGIFPLSRIQSSSNTGVFVRKGLAKPNGTVDPCVLKDKVVSFGAASGYSSISTWYLNDWFQTCKQKFTIKDVTLNTLAGATLAAGLQAGSVDVGYISDPVATQVAESDYAVLALKQPAISLGAYFVSPKVAGDTKLSTAIARALLRTTRKFQQGDYHENPKVLTALSKVLGLPEETIAAAPPMVTDPNGSFDSAADPLAGLQETWMDVGGILTYSKPIAPKQVVTDKFVQRALAGK